MLLQLLGLCVGAGCWEVEKPQIIIPFSGSPLGESMMQPSPMEGKRQIDTPPAAGTKYGNQSVMRPPCCARILLATGSVWETVPIFMRFSILRLVMG